MLYFFDSSQDDKVLVLLDNFFSLSRGLRLVLPGLQPFSFWAFLLDVRALGEVMSVEPLRTRNETFLRALYFRLNSFKEAD
jgi:hypothetical protein